VRLIQREGFCGRTRCFNPGTDDEALEGAFTKLAIGRFSFFVVEAATFIVKTPL